MDTLIIEKKDDVYLTVDCDPNVQREISEFFTFYVPGYKFMPAFRTRMWDGKIRLYSQKFKEIYFGLYPYIKAFAEERGYQVVVGKNVDIDNKVNREVVTKFSNSLGQKFEARDYQIDAIYHSLKYNRVLLLSPTASGKSFIIYALIRYYTHLLKDEPNNRCLVIVPTTSLVEQMYTDFEDYGWSSGTYCQKIYQGYDKKVIKDVVISTWQSIYKMPKKYFEQFSVIIGDEAHLATANSLKGILEKSTFCRYKFGTTGTLTDCKTHKLVLEGLFGKTYTAITSKELMDNKHISKLNIQCLQLEYPEEERKTLKKATYQEEIDFIVSHEKRNNFICDLALIQKGNTLILFNYVEKHGKILLKMLMDKDSKRQIFFIAGETDVEQREDIRRATEEEKNAIIVASSGVLSTGVNIKNLQYLIFAHPYKAKIRNLQSIGRVLRLDDKNNKAVLYDIIDDLHWKKRNNYGLKHWKERLSIYLKEKFDYDYSVITL